MEKLHRMFKEATNLLKHQLNFLSNSDQVYSDMSVSCTGNNGEVKKMP